MDRNFEKSSMQVQRGTSQRPLLGLTILLVEDSRYCSEAVRLLCVRSGARLRRADSVSSAYKHLATYRPNLVLVDVGLPDVSGLVLVRDLAGHRPNAPVILVTSGEDQAIARAEAKAAGADGFLEKPMRNVLEFQSFVLKFFPDREANLAGSNVIPFRVDIEPDPLAVEEDLRHARDLLVNSGVDETETHFYCAQFLTSVAEACGEPALGKIARNFRAGLEDGADTAALINGVGVALSDRLGMLEVV